MYGDEHLLPEDLKAERGQSLLSKELKEAELKGLTRDVDMNTLLSSWVMELLGVKEDWGRFEKLFLDPQQCGGFKPSSRMATGDYWITGRSDGLGSGHMIALTAREETHRRNHTQYVEKMPSAPSMKTSAEKSVRLVLEPPVEYGAGGVIPGAAVLEYSTRITETLAGGSPVVRKPRVKTENVSVKNLKQLVMAYRKAAGMSTDGVNKMIASEGSHGVGTGLRNEIWRFVRDQDPGWLTNADLKKIFADEIAGFQWVPKPAGGSAAAAAAPAAPAPTAPAGWVAMYSPTWAQWLFRNNTGDALTVSPADTASAGSTQDEEEGEGGGRGRAGVPTGTQLAARPSRSRSTQESPREAPRRQRQRGDGAAASAAFAYNMDVDGG